jgi:hypothetical protein
MNTDGCIKTGHSLAQDAKTAVAEFARQVSQKDMALVMFFCSITYDLDSLAEEMNRQFQGVLVVGCTTAGEIGPSGYVEHSLSGLSFPADTCTAVVGRVDDLDRFKIAEGHAFAQALVHELGGHGVNVSASTAFGFLLVDGMSMHEEPVAHAMQSGLGAIQMIGGSAGDDLKFQQTWIFHDGAFHTNSAVLSVVSTTIPFRTIRSQHFVTDEERVVVTDANASERIIREINGLPAAEEYARLVGVEPGDLKPSHFAAWPVVVMIDGTDYVRSIQKVNQDGSLTFYCAIEDGLVLRVARGTDMLGKLKETIHQLQDELGAPQAILVCDCILRNLEAARTGVKGEIANVFLHNNAVGFSTYGEQFAGVHVNQTLTGVAFGR